MDTDLLGALDLRGFMRIVGVDDEGEDERATLVHACEYHMMVSNQMLFLLPASARHL
jgi:hypothetical protein